MGQSQKYFFKAIYYIARGLCPNFSPLGPKLKEEIGNKGIKWPLLYIYTSSSCPGFPGQFNAFPVFTMLSRDFPCFLVIFEAFGEVSPLQVSSRKKAWDFPGFNSTSRAGISRAFSEFLVSPVFSRDFPCFPRIFHAIPGFPMLSQDIPSLPGISHAFTGFPMHSQYFQVFGEIWSVISPLRYQKVLAFAGERKTSCI